MDKKYTLKELTALAKKVKLLTLEISYKARTCHVGSALSISDILSVLYFIKLNITATNRNSNSRDRFILSKGHAAAALYAVLYKKGIISSRKLFSFGQNNGLCEHPEMHERGIEMTTGSLGHGLAFGIGISYGLRLQREKGNVFVLISDGECGEGSVWEAALLAPRLKLDNLTVIIDYNKWQCFGATNDVTLLEPFADKWKTFGWEVVEVDGHNIRKLKRVFDKIPLKKQKPTVVIAHTISGKGVSCIEDQLIGHYKVFTREEYMTAKKELEVL